MSRTDMPTCSTIKVLYSGSCSCGRTVEREFTERTPTNLSNAERWVRCKRCRSDIPCRPSTNGAEGDR